MRQRILLALPLLSWAALLTCCAMSERGQVDKVLEARRLGMEKKDIELYMSSISLSYEGEEGVRDRLREKALDMMEAFDSIRMRISHRQVAISGLRAEAIQIYQAQVRRGDRIRELKGKERIALKKEAGGWKIVSGL